MLQTLSINCSICPHTNKLLEHMSGWQRDDVLSQVCMNGFGGGVVYCNSNNFWAFEMNELNLKIYMYTYIILCTDGKNVFFFFFWMGSLLMFLFVCVAAFVMCLSWALASLAVVVGSAPKLLTRFLCLVLSFQMEVSSYTTSASRLITMVPACLLLFDTSLCQSDIELSCLIHRL